MPTHFVMTQADGDKPFAFDSTKKDEVAEAMARFDDLVKNQKHFAVKPAKDGEPAKLLKDFDPEADVVFHPQLIGG